MGDNKTLNVAVIGAGLGGLSTGIALRQQGHQVSLYDRSDFEGEIGAGLGIVSNATRLLEGEWGVALSSALPVVLRNMTQRDWKDSALVGKAFVGDYKAKFGYHYYGSLRFDLHSELWRAALDEDRPGPPCKLFTKHKLESVDFEKGECRFENGTRVQADLIVGADGAKSQVRKQIGIHPDVSFGPTCCYRLVISHQKLAKIGMAHLLENCDLNFWPGQGLYKVVAGPAHSGEIFCMYAFFPADTSEDPHDFDWQIPATAQQMKNSFPDLDPNLHALFDQAEDIHVWRYLVHPEYPYWTKGRVGLLGDAAHPMMPDQNQGFGQAVEDAAALGFIFSKENAHLVNGNVSAGLAIYEQVRKERATIVQAASLRASMDLRERFGFRNPDDPPDKLTVEWLCEYDMKRHITQVIGDREKIEAT